MWVARIKLDHRAIWLRIRILDLLTLAVSAVFFGFLALWKFGIIGIRDGAV